MYDGPVRGGTRGGQGDFRWSQVANDKHRENYLGHTVNAPVGRWQKNQDIHWYNREIKDDDQERAAREKAEEIRRVKEQEEDALNLALGLAPKQRNHEDGDSGEGTGSNDIPVKGQNERDKEIERLEKEEKKREKALRKEQRALKRVEKEVKREEKDHKRSHRHESRRHRDDDSDYERERDRHRSSRHRDDRDRERRRDRDEYKDRYRSDRDKKHEDVDRYRDRSSYRDEGRTRGRDHSSTPPPKRERDRTRSISPKRERSRTPERHRRRNELDDRETDVKLSRDDLGRRY